MTELELQILDNAKEHIPYLKAKLKNIRTNCKFVTFTIKSGHTFDTVVFDNEIGKFVKVTYLYWDGNINHKTEFKDIDLTNIEL